MRAYFSVYLEGDSEKDILAKFREVKLLLDKAANGSTYVDYDLDLEYDEEEADDED